MPPINLSLNPYNDSFGIEQASHLLRRTTFAFNKDMRDSAMSLGVSASVDLLLADTPAPSPPLNFGFIDLLTPVGQTWVDKLYLNDSGVQRQTSLNAWTIELMATSGMHVREKMVLFWVNHFGISNIRDANYLFQYSTTIRNHALGNVKQLIKDITINPSILRFLNGNSNTKNSPNENYARELLELFTLGKGPLAGPGDYTNYTEGDIKEIARVLTGWRAIGYRGAQLQLPGSIFISNRHDQREKQLSHRFGNAVIPNGNEDEYSQLIDILFIQDEVARFICRKIYRWFVYYEITPEIETAVIDQLALTLISNNYEINSVLDQLLKSQHFFDAELMGCQIKNPYEFILPIFSALNTQTPLRLANRYRFYASLYFGGGILDMVYFDIPQVAGWKAYYQEPVYYRYWINNVTLGLRKTIVDLVLSTGIEAGDQFVKPDLLDFIATLPEPSDPNKLISHTALLIFTKPLSVEQVNVYKESLIPGLPDFEWTVEYNNHLADPNDDLLKLSIQAKLTTLFAKMLNAPDFQLQ